MPIVTVPGVGNVTFPDSMSQDQILSAIENDILKKPATNEVMAAKPPERTIGNIAGDIGVTALKGAVGLPQAAAGLADIPFGLAGLGSPVTSGLEKAGVRFADTQKALEEMYSPAQKAAFERVQKAQGFIPTAVEAIQNPSVPLAIAGQAIPQMLGGAGAARALIAKGVPALTAVGAGEGLLGAGSAAAEMRETGAEGFTPKEALAALGSGVITGALGVAGGKAARALGLDDIDTLIARGGKGAAEAATAKSGYLKAIAGSGLSEGFLEEMPQSAQEQMWKNWAGDKPLLEGVPEAASLGAVVGVGFGGVGGAAGRYMRDQAPQQSEFDRRRAEIEGKAPAITPFDEASPLENPYGNIPAADIGDVAAQINGARAKRKQSPLQSFSVEDIVESGLPPEQTDQLLSAALTKSGFDPSQAVEPQDIMDAAAERGLDPEQPGFRDFLRRASGAENPEQMTPVQRVAAFGAIQSLPEGVDSLPTGTNAQRFTEPQYRGGLKAIKGAISGGASRDSLIAAIQKTGVDDVRDAQSILQNAIKGGELGAVSTPTFTVMDDFGKPVRSYDSRDPAEQLAGRLNGQVEESSVTKFVSPEMAGGDVRPGSYRDEPSGFEIRAGDAVLRKTDTAEDAEVAAERLQQIRGRLASTFNNQVEGINQKIATSNQPLEVMEAQGQAETPQYAKLKKQADKNVQELAKKRDGLVKQAAEFSRPLHVGVAAPKAVGKTGFTRFEAGRPVEYLSSLGALPKPTTGPVTDRDVANIDALRKTLLPALKRFGLEGVGLRVVKSIEDGGAGADGSYASRLIQIALSAENPMGVMRHEVIHALKELGAFKPREWRALERQAKSEWIGRFIEETGLMERYQQVYQEQTGSLEGFDEYIAEEAIAEAFKYFDQTKPPVGLIGNLFNRLRNLFGSLRNALQGAGFQTADEVLGRIEEGKVTPTQAEVPAAAPKFSVAPETDEQFFIRQQNKPDAKQVVFEIAPNPDDADLSGEWNSLSAERRHAISNKLKDSMTKKVLDVIGARGRIASQVGSYENETNASFALFLEKGDALEVAKGVGFAFSQKAMMAVSPKKSRGLREYGSVTIEIGDKNFDQIQDIYNALRQIDLNGKSPVGGQTTANGVMTILNDSKDSGVNTEDLADIIDATLGYKYNVLTRDVYAAFPGAKEYDYASAEDDGSGSRADIRRGLRSIRDEASEAIRKEIDAARGQPKAGAKAGEAKRVTTDTIVIDGVIRSTRNSNGKSIHSTEEGVRNFWKWFGDAVTVDRRGRPVVMYHGTSRDITEFRPRQANAIFITPNPNFADDFTSISEVEMRGEFFNSMTPEQRYEMIMGAAKKYLDRQYINRGDYNKIKNDYKGLDFKYKKIPTELETEVDERISNALPSRANILPLYVAAKNPFDFENPKHVDKLINTIEGGGGYIDDIEVKDIKLGRWAAIEGNHIQKALIDARFDGFFVNEGGEKNLAVYDRRQIKSAVGNQGTFSPKSKDIRYSIAQTKAPEFKRWFGDSKIVDEKGNPLVVYHGTKKDFSSFKTKYGDGLFFFSTNSSFASNWPVGTGGLREGPEGTKDEVERIRALDASLRGTYMKDGYDFKTPEGEAAFAADRAALRKALKEKTGYASSVDFENNAGIQVMPVYLSIQNPFDPRKDYKKIEPLLRSNGMQNLIDGDYHKSGNWVVYENKDVIDELKNLGYDGIWLAENVGGPHETIAAFTNTQIKSATGNRGTFDPTNPDIRYSIEKDIKNRFGQARLDSIKQKTAARNEETFVDRMIGAISPESRERLRKQMINKYEPIERNSKILADRFGESRLFADQSAISAALFSDRAAGVAAEAFKSGIPVYDKGYTKVDDMGGKVKGLLDTLSPLMKYNDPFVFQAFQFYGATRRGARLYQEGREKLLTPQDIQFGRQLEQTYPEFKQVFDEYQKYNRGIVKYLVDTGVLSEEMGKKWSMYSDYIPFYRQASGEQTFGPKIFHNLSGVQPSKKLKGGEFKLDDFMETVVRNTRSAIEQGMKNVAAQRAVRDAMALNAPNQFDYAKRLPSGATGGQDVVNVREKGVDVKYQVADPLWVEAMKGFYAPNPYETMLKIVGFPTSLLRNIVTKMPDFIVANLLRDSMSAWVTSGMKFKPIIDTFKQVGLVLARQSPEAAALRAAGIGSGYDFAGDTKASAKAFGKELRKKTGKRTAGEIAMLPLSSVWDALDAGSNASDIATRAEIFKRTLAETGNEAEAVFRAMEVMNFSRMGSSPLVQIMSAITPFFNARVQGLDLIYRAGTGRLAQANRKTAHKVFMVRATTMFALSVLYWMLASDSDEYKKADEETRDNNWIIGKVKIPIPFEIGVMFKVVPERMMGYLFGTDTGKDVKEAAFRNIISTLSMNPVPQAFLPILEANITDSGYSAFTGRSIVPRGLDDVAKPLQETSMTSIAAKKLGKELGVSPIKIDHVIRGYFGAMGTYTSMALDAMLRTTSDPIKPAMTLEQTPVLRRFFASDKAQGTVNAFYDLKDRVDELARTTSYLQLSGRFDDFDAYIKENGRLLELKPMLSHIEKDLKRIREMEKVVNSAREGDMTAEEKRLVLDQVRESKNYLTDQMRVLRKEVSRQP